MAGSVAAAAEEDGCYDGAVFLQARLTTWAVLPSKWLSVSTFRMAVPTSRIERSPFFVIWSPSWDVSSIFRIVEIACWVTWFSLALLRLQECVQQLLSLNFQRGSWAAFPNYLGDHFVVKELRNLLALEGVKLHPIQWILKQVAFSPADNSPKPLHSKLS